MSMDVPCTQVLMLADINMMSKSFLAHTARVYMFPCMHTLVLRYMNVFLKHFVPHHMSVHIPLYVCTDAALDQ
jgi:hypothetical protein